MNHDEAEDENNLSLMFAPNSARRSGARFTGELEEDDGENGLIQSMSEVKDFECQSNETSDQVKVMLGTEGSINSQKSISNRAKAAQLKKIREIGKKKQEQLMEDCKMR